ncbi:AAA family ATPase [Azoarcus sp. KH32C]|uniref:AAA family ATPase n=1 Tax=Azoarcus sp. KH32C TaxID=748247 RepID=UPI0002386101|nr:AAA family ATPase [Azoarcus sp. KH32C]BAL23513.1 exodeoxyribonuclease V, alpha subunit [Azoarcus sp. KH32C]
MSAPSRTLRVGTIRSQNPLGRGGAIFTGVEIDDNGNRIDAKAHVVVKAPHFLLQGSVEAGQLWRITGVAENNAIVVNGYRLIESTIVPETMELLRPSGEHLVTLLAECDAFKGIGFVKARRLWDRFGEDLYALLDAGAVNRLAEVLPAEMAAQLADAWRRWGDTFTLQWLQNRGFTVALGRKVLEYFGSRAAEKIEEDPYRLISFAADWKTTDTLARHTFGLAEDDPRRLAGAVEEALYGAFDAGHTCISQTQFGERLGRLLGAGCDSVLIARALQHGDAAGAFLHRSGQLHALGPFVMEYGTAQAIAERAARPEALLSRGELARVLDDYQRESGLTLESSQLDALKVANANPVTVITGGAGTGKTTVLKGWFAVCRAAGWPIFAMALSGRAARRIREATGQEASTIAGFLKRFDPKEAPERAVVVIDEASMVDLPSAYRVIRHLPDTYRFVLVGDPNQLAPVGPGLLLHELAHQVGIPRVELQQVKRYSGAIAEAANAIRSGHWTALPDDPREPIAFLPCRDEDINEVVLDLLADHPHDSQVLAAVRNAAAGGVKVLNHLSQKRLNAVGVELLLWNEEFDQCQGTGLRVGDPVICLANDWDKNLQNGSLGTLLSVEAPIPNPAPGQVLGRIRWDDGEERELTPDLLPNLELAYAITIHKAQGSQFPRIIVPVRHSRLLDRTLLYTAITRAQRQVILVGDVGAAKAAVEAPPHAALRQVALGSMLVEILEAM